VHSIGDLYHLYTYEGPAPWTNGALVEKPGILWGEWNSSERDVRVRH
jgi:hypothetical protein